MAVRFHGIPMRSAAGGITTVSVFRTEGNAADAPPFGVYQGELEMDPETAVEFVECLRLGSGLARIFEDLGV